MGEDVTVLGPEQRDHIWRATDLTCGWRSYYAWFTGYQAPQLAVLAEPPVGDAPGGCWMYYTGQMYWQPSVAGAADVTTALITHGQRTEGIIFEPVSMSEVYR